MKKRHYFLLFIKGLGMGTADVIPSISSSTIALITGIYGKLIEAIYACNRTAFNLLKAGKWRLFWDYIQGNFLFFVCLGVGTSLFSTARLVRYFLINYPIETWAFFFGISINASITTYQQIRKINFLSLCLSGIGIVIVYFIVQLPPVVSPDAYWFIFIAGTLAVCAMILPGISGSFILLILGKYRFMLDALHKFDWPILCTFILGGLIGLLIFSKFLVWLLKTYNDQTISLLAGFMLGSLPTTWPWKSIISPNETNSSVLLANNISPMHFQSLHLKDPHILQALFYLSLGCLVVILLKKWKPHKHV